jgi:hypothetical protein
MSMLAVRAIFGRARDGNCGQSLMETSVVAA